MPLKQVGDNLSGGQWAEYEKMHSNVLELKAAFIEIPTYCHNRSHKHIKVMSNSSTAIEYINTKAGIKSKKCNKIAKEIWLWFFKNNYLISAAHQENTMFKQTNFLNI